MKEILVYADWQGLGEPAKIGVLRTEQVRGEEIFSFVYDSVWLNSGNAKYIDPDLKLYTGPQYINDYKPNFGVFLDSSPDRWGRMLLERKEAIEARHEQRQKKRLTESDFLLGLSDETRMGALRFKLNEENAFLADSSMMKTPPLTSIRELEQISLKVEDDGFFESKDAAKWLNILVAPGSSLGGARPKANVIDPEGNLWIAKFPSNNDYTDKGAWEYLVYQMANEMGINMSVSHAQKYSQNQNTFLTKRFDRNKDIRIHFASAMCLLGYKDGYSFKDGGSYLEIVELIEQYGVDPTKDIRELWKRIVFSVAISNTDDHLRNHGFLMTKHGWKLSPAYDINPTENASGLSLNISENDNSLDFDLCMDVIDYYRWNEKEAMEYITKTKEVASTWRIRANNIGISKLEQNIMESAFLP